MEQLPEIIFELLKSKSFEALSTTEKKLVLRHMDAMHYNELFKATELTKTIVFDAKKVISDKGNKAILMAHLKSKNKKASILNYPVAFWKIAASFILFALIGYFYLNSKIRNEQPVYLTNTDTVYIEKISFRNDTPDFPIPVRMISEKNRVGGIEKIQINSTNGVPEQPLVSIQGTELNHLSIGEYEKLINNKKGHSIKDDSLITSIGFSTL